MRCIALRVLQSLKGFGFFCFVNRLSGGGGSVIQITMQRAHPAWSVKTKLKIAWLKIAHEYGRKSRWWGEFLSREGGRHCFILASDKNKKDQKRLRSKLVDIARNRTITNSTSNESWNTETKKTDWNLPTIKEKSMTVLACSIERVFPKRSSKIKDWTEKPKIPSKFAKLSAWYNEVGRKVPDNLGTL